jgi:hypothetical protein
MLYRLFRQRGLTDIVVDPRTIANTSYQIARNAGHLDKAGEMAVAAGVVTADELARWRRGLEQVEAEGAFFSSLSLFLVAGRKA